jgi:hypothetical protein
MQNMFPLPIEINNLILEFTGYHKIRNGKYLKQLDHSCRQIVDLQERLLVRPQMKNGFVVLRFNDDSKTALFNHTYDYLSSGRL